MSGRNSARRLRRHAAQRLAQRVDPQAEPRRLRPKLGEFAYVILARRPASDLREDLAAYLLGRLSNAGPRTRTTVPARGRRPKPFTEAGVPIQRRSTALDEYRTITIGPTGNAEGVKRGVARGVSTPVLL